MHKFSILFIISLILLVLPNMLIAQPPIDPGCNPDLGCPIDNGVVALIAGVICIAGYKAYTIGKSLTIN